MARRNNYSADLADTVIASGLAVKGDLNSDNDILVDGTVEGSIVTKGNLIIGQPANINGNLQARSVTIAGQLNGDVDATEAVILEASAHLEGNVTAPQLSIASGAYLRGKVAMEMPEEAQEEEQVG